MLFLPFTGSRQFIRYLIGQLPLPSCKSNILGLWARMMADDIVQNDDIPHENAEKGDASLFISNGGVKHLLDEEADVVSSKKLKIDSKEEFQNAESARRKKVALLLAYCGHGYYGMQKNPGMKTIEDDLLSALLKAGLISKENFEIPQTMQFQRAARTDKGVSAARQVVSMRIPLSGGLVEKINSYLPSVIKVMSIKRTTRGFNSKFWCDARTYSYTLPTFAFAPVIEKTTEDYRITDDVIERLNSVIKIFKGTHNFHNFTSGRKPDEASAKRYIIEVESGNPFIEDGMEFLTITMKGQSFMLHQIRKMIGITIAIMRDLTSPNIIEKAWDNDKVDIPIAPGVGLMLEQLHYEKYNKRYANDGLHDALEWDDLEETIENFKRNHIRLPLLVAEKDEKSMFQWLSTLPLHTYDVQRNSSNHPNRRSQTRSELGRAMVAIELEKQGGEKEDGIETDTKTESPTEKLDVAKSVNPIEDLPESSTPSVIQQETFGASSPGHLQ